MNVAYKIHTRRTLLEYRATIHYATRITLASLSFGCYSCLLLFLCPLISWRGLFAASWRRTFGLFLSVAILVLLLRWYNITDPGAVMSGPIGVIIFPFVTIIIAVFLCIWTLYRVAGKPLTRSTIFTCFCTAQTSTFQKVFVKLFRIFR